MTAAQLSERWGSTDRQSGFRASGREGAMIQTEMLAYSAGGIDMRGELYLPDGAVGGLPAILVFPEAPGLSDQTRDRARRHAELGHVALACDLHGGGEMLRDMPRVMSELAVLRANVEGVRARASGAYEALVARPEVDREKIVATGYCFGGTMALELARSGAPLAAVVGFHCGLATPRPEDAHNIRGKILVCTGADDPSIDRDQRAAFEREMTEAGVDWRVNLYGGVLHAFTSPGADRMGRPDFARYDAAADRRSWAEMRIFLEEVLHGAD